MSRIYHTTFTAHRQGAGGTLTATSEGGLIASVGIYFLVQIQ
jgi:hypothetical protein